MRGTLLRVSHRSMFKDNNCPPELVLLAASVLRRLTGILEEPGIVKVGLIEGDEVVAQEWTKYSMVTSSAWYQIPVWRVVFIPPGVNDKQ